MCTRPFCKCSTLSIAGCSAARCRRHGVDCGCPGRLFGRGLPVALRMRRRPSPDDRFSNCGRARWRKLASAACVVSVNETALIQRKRSVAFHSGCHRCLTHACATCRPRYMGRTEVASRNSSRGCYADPAHSPPRCAFSAIMPPADGLALDEHVGCSGRLSFSALCPQRWASCARCVRWVRRPSRSSARRSAACTAWRNRRLSSSCTSGDWPMVCMVR
mmetsp:Transcript_100929/g.284748  ORF Transcript_100929/g.284748 Transcript_100929/m.284748 type:complete len:218 (+) Transcript_100929:320-973(+)